MKLSTSEITARYNANDLKIAFIGMSNIGKSYTAYRLQSEYNFSVLEIDALIIEKLGQTSMAEFAAWQGQPYETGYAEREARSINLETQALLEALNCSVGNTLFDTPGSVIYTEKHALERMCTECLIVYIKAQNSDLERLKHDYFENPKPLIWNGQFIPKKGLSNHENILKSYPNLLKARAQTYEKIADITLEANFILKATTKPKALFEALLQG